MAALRSSRYAAGLGGGLTGRSDGRTQKTSSSTSAKRAIEEARNIYFIKMILLRVRVRVGHVFFNPLPVARQIGAIRRGGGRCGGRGGGRAGVGPQDPPQPRAAGGERSEEHSSQLQALRR